MRLLALDTSTPIGSVALLENGEIASRCTDRPNAHAETLLGLIDQLFVTTGWQAAEVDRVVVGVGPGSFTGVRVGVALATGIARGLNVPLFGIGSLAAMAFGVPSDISANRITVVDARRGELFIAEYSADGSECSPPRLASPEQVTEELRERNDAQIVGPITESLGFSPYRSKYADGPSAHGVGLLGARLAPPGGPVEPAYARDADAILPNLPPSPLARDR